MRVSPTVLKILAAATWSIGGIVLLYKGCALLIEAWRLQASGIMNYFPLPAGFVIGALKARYLFSHSCQKNLERIDSLTDPKLFQFFRPKFFLFLIAMILLGVLLSQLAHGRYGMLIGVSSLDMTISVALLGSLYAFKRK